MQAIEALLNRVSCGKLQAPAPSQEQLSVLQGAALRAADHGGLRPWRFLVVEGEGLDRLGTLYLEAALRDDTGLSESQRARYLAMPKRAPMVVVAIAEAQPHAKVPVSEQLLATGAAVQNLITAAYALGLGAYWRTGALAYHEQVKEGLGVSGAETIVGFVYLGTPAAPLKAVPENTPADFFESWPAK